MNTLANNFVLHLRIFKKAKEKLQQNINSNANNNVGSSSNNNNSGNNATTIINEEASLLEYFFDLEADLEKGICRDEVCYNLNGKELG